MERPDKKPESSGKDSPAVLSYLAASQQDGRSPGMILTLPVHEPRAWSRGAPRPKKAPRENTRGRRYENELEIEFQLHEMLGSPDYDERSHAKSIQSSTDAIDRFFDRLELDKALSHHAGSAQRLTGSNSEPKALDHLREFMKAEKERVPTMTAREIRSSVVNVLRKAADAMAAV